MPDWFFQVVPAVAAAASVYAAIRADLARLHERTEHTREAIKTAHERIDKLQCVRGQGCPAGCGH